jgi:glycosyltransferase involved in cell wall biosynthesis
MKNRAKIKIFRTSTVQDSLISFLSNQIKFLNKNGFDTYTLSANSIDIDSFEEKIALSKHFTVALKRKIFLFYDLLALVQTIIIFKKIKPVIVHSITPKAGLISMIAAYFAGVPIRIHTFTGLIFPTKSGLMKELLILMDKVLCRFATHIYPEGQGVCNDLMTYKITNKQLKIIGNGSVCGIDVKHYKPISDGLSRLASFKTNLGIKEDDFVFLFVGRLVRDKGINELVLAFSKMALNNFKLKLLLVGSFDLTDPLSTATITEIDSNEQIIRTGFQNDVRPYFEISNLFVFPSYREGFPNVLLQAACYSLPIIATNINGCNEIIIENENGLLFEPKNLLSLENTMNYIYNNPKLCEKFSTNTRDLITKKFDQDYVCRSLLNEYNNILAQFKNDFKESY